VTLSSRNKTSSASSRFISVDCILCNYTFTATPFRQSL
jgi:ribosomal protein S27E